MSVRPWDPPPEVRANPGRTADSHTSFKFEAELIGGHVHVTVRAATRHLTVEVDHSRARLGILIMDPAEWLLLRTMLLTSTPPDPIWILEDRTDNVTTGRLIAAAGPEISYHEHQHFIDVEGWPDE